MPAAPHDEHDADEPGGILMGSALEIHPVGGLEQDHGGGGHGHDG